jgi:hypothetical protein
LYSSQAIQGCACLPCLWTPCPKSTLTGEPWVSPSSTPTVKWSFRSGVAVGGHLENNIAPSMPTRLHQRADYWRGADRVTDAISHSWLFTMLLHSRSNSKSDGVVAVKHCTLQPSYPSCNRQHPFILAYTDLTLAQTQGQLSNCQKS